MALKILDDVTVVLKFILVLEQCFISSWLLRYMFYKYKIYILLQLSVPICSRAMKDYTTRFIHQWMKKLLFQYGANQSRFQTAEIQLHVQVRSNSSNFWQAVFSYRYDVWKSFIGCHKWKNNRFFWKGVSFSH